MMIAATLLSLSFSYLLQGVLLLQLVNYLLRSWRADALVTRGIVSLVLVLSLSQSSLLLSSVLLNDRRLSSATVLNAKCLSIAAQYFFALRVYHIPWRYDFLFIPLPFLLVGSFGSAVGSFLATPGSDIFHKLVIVSSVFPFLLSAWSTACILGYHLTAPKSIKQPSAPHLHLILHAALPGTLILLLAITGAASSVSGLNTVAVQVGGYIHAICALWVLTNRPHRNAGGETSPEIETRRTLKDLLWTRIRGPPSPTTISHRVTLLPIHMDRMRSQDAALAPVTGSDKSFWFSHAFALNNDEYTNVGPSVPVEADADPFSKSDAGSPSRPYSIKSLHSTTRSIRPENTISDSRSIDARSTRSIPYSMKTVYSTPDTPATAGSIRQEEADEDVETDGHSSQATGGTLHHSPSRTSTVSSFLPPSPVTVPVTQPAAVHVSPNPRPSYSVQSIPQTTIPTTPPRRSASSQRSLLYPVTPRGTAAPSSSRAVSSSSLPTRAVSSSSLPARAISSSSGRLQSFVPSSLPHRAPLPPSFTRSPPPPTPHSSHSAGSTLTFMPPGLYDPREFQAIKGKVESNTGETL